MTIISSIIPIKTNTAMTENDAFIVKAIWVVWLHDKKNNTERKEVSSLRSHSIIANKQILSEGKDEEKWIIAYNQILIHRNSANQTRSKCTLKPSKIRVGKE